MITAWDAWWLVGGRGGGLCHFGSYEHSDHLYVFQVHGRKLVEFELLELGQNPNNVAHKPNRVEGGRQRLDFRRHGRKVQVHRRVQGLACHLDCGRERQPLAELGLAAGLI